MRRTSRAPGIPESLAEVLCRDDFDSPKLEIVGHFNRATNEAVTRIYSSAAFQPDFSVSRLLSMNSVRYVSEEIIFNLDFSKSQQGERVFAGQIESSALPGLGPQKLTCIIGGSLDTSNWSFTSMTDRIVESFGILDNDSVRFTSYLPRSGIFSQAVHHHFKVGFHTPETDITMSNLGDGYTIALEYPTPLKNESHQFIFYNVRKRGDYIWQAHYIWDLKNSRLVQLTNLNQSQINPNWEASSYIERAVIAATGEVLFPVQQVFGGNLLRSYDIASGKVTTLFRIPGQLRFRELPNSKQVVVASRLESAVEYMLYDLGTRTLRAMAVQFPEGCRSDGQLLEVLNNGTGFIESATCGVNGEIRVFLVTLQDGGVKTLAINKQFRFLSADDKWSFFADSAQQNSFVVNLETFESFASPISPRLGPNKYTPVMMGRYWYGFDAESSDPHLIQTDLQTRTSIRLCESSLGTRLGVGVIQDAKVYIYSYEKTAKVYRFYHVKSPTECLRLNEFPSSSSIVHRASSTEIGFAMSLYTPGTEWSMVNQPSELVFVPVDGRPPLRLNHGSAQGWYFEITPDRKHIVILGPDSAGQNRLLSFDFLGIANPK